MVRDGFDAAVNDAQHTAYQTYIRDLADRLLLKDWEFELKREWADDDAYAEVSVSRDEDHFSIHITEGLAGYPPEQRREWLVHEILHAHTARAEQQIERLEELLSDNQAVKLAKQAFDDEMEIVIQRLARILAPMMPLPPEVK
jgi:hypothetical protein